ncbi:MAG TPA: tetraacyldisaccharide 4'-kinase [Burkholderiales bacterium]
MRYWYRRGLAAWALWPASLAFRAAVAVRRVLYRLRLLKSAHPGIPVIVVGNLSVGGTGKTPLVLWIAEHLQRQGWKPGIVSRGYGAAIEAPRAATIASEAGEVGDEPIVLSRRSGCPVWVGAQRVAVIEALRAANPDVDVVILDDGLQHYRLRRDIEIAVVDARGFGNGFLLPAGPLREPVSRLRSVDAVVSHGAAVKGFAMRLAGDTLHRMSDARERRPAASFAGAKVHAVAGIGDPNRFFLHLVRLGVKLVPHPFPDHHPFRTQDLDFGDEAPVLMTEKDAVKLRHAASSNVKRNWWVLPVSAELEPAFGDWLSGRLDEFRRRPKTS